MKAPMGQLRQGIPPVPYGNAENRQLQIQLQSQTAHALLAAQTDRETTLLSHTWDAAQIVLKSAFTLNGAALVAILALIGAVIQHGGPRLPHDQLRSVLGYFGTGLFLATLAGFVAYFVQSTHFWAARATEFSIEPPFLKVRPEQVRLAGVANWLTYLGIGFVLASVGMALAGSVAAEQMMEAALATATPTAYSAPPGPARPAAPAVPTAHRP